jgi:hypothetical protein
LQQAIPASHKEWRGMCAVAHGRYNHWQNVLFSNGQLSETLCGLLEEDIEVSTYN